jgi:hypothetical protein
MANYNRVNGLCIQCPATQYYDAALKVCRPRCNANEDYNRLNNLCECSQGFFRIGTVCDKCPAGTTYQASTRSCISICGNNENYNPLTAKCECRVGFNLIQGRCGN